MDTKLRATGAALNEDINLSTGPNETVQLNTNKSRKKLSATYAAYLTMTLFMVIYCARPEDWIPGLVVVPLAKIAGVLSLAALLLSLGQIRQRFPREVIFLLLLIAQLFLTVPMSSVWRGGAFVHALDFAKVGLIVIVMITACVSFKRLKQLLIIQAASVATVCAVTLIKGRVRGGRLEGVLNGNYSNSNDLALSIVISLPICIGLLFLSKSSLWKLFWGVASLVMCFTLIRTGSRGGFLALAISGCFCIWDFAIKGQRFYLLPLVGLLIIVLLIFSSGTLFERLKSTFSSQNSVSTSDESSAYESAQSRQLLLRRSIEVTLQHPLFGVGPGNFQVVSGIWHESHNSYTQMSAEGGIPALIIYLAILWSGFKNLGMIRRRPKSGRNILILVGALNACLVAYVVGSFFGSVAYHFYPYFIVTYTSLLLAIVRNSLNKENESTKKRLGSENVTSQSLSPGFSASHY
jgi:O-antigen ligase